MKSEILFLGNGRYSMADCWELHNKFMHALTILDGIQQPVHAGNDHEAKMTEGYTMEGEQEIESIVRDIAMALTGKKIRFINE